MKSNKIKFNDGTTDFSVDNPNYGTIELKFVSGKIQDVSIKKNIKVADLKK